MLLQSKLFGPAEKRFEKAEIKERRCVNALVRCGGVLVAADTSEPIHSHWLHVGEVIAHFWAAVGDLRNAMRPRLDFFVAK